MKLFCSVCITPLMVIHLLVAFCSQNLEVVLMTIRLSVCLFKIHDHIFWEFGDYISYVATLADMVSELIQEIHLQKFETWFVDKMLCNFWLDLRFIFINVSTACSRRNIVPSWVTLQFLLFVQSKVFLKGCEDRLCRFTCRELTEIMLRMMKLLQIILHVLDCDLSMWLVLCHEVKIHKDLDAQQGIWEGNPVAYWRV